MFEIKEITVNCAVSKNYQKAEFSMTATVECDEDIAAVKNMCTQHALELLETLPIKEEPKQVQPTTQQKPNNQFQAPRVQPVQNQGYAPRQQYQNNTPRMASEKQLNYLRSFGWNGNPNITWDQANQLLQQYKAQNGIQ